MSTRTDDLTRVQRRALNAIRDLGHELHRPPTHRELQAALGYKSSQTTFALLGRLEAAGAIRREGRYRYRGIRLTDGTDPADVRRALEALARALHFWLSHPGAYAAAPVRVTQALATLLQTGWTPTDEGETP